MVYQIISGPVTQQPQTNPVFNSLPAGDYTIQITDGTGSQTTASTTITGNYLNPDFTAIPTAPYCVGESSGKIAVNTTNGTGLAPFSWQLMPPSPTSGTLNGDTFENLPAGSYSVRVTDACGSISTKAVTITSPSSFMKFYGGLGMMKVGCDSVKAIYKLDILEAKLPFTYSFQTPNGTQIIPIGAPTITGGTANMTGYVTFEHILPNVTYGDTIKVTITNACGEQISSTLYSHPYYFHPYYTALECGNAVNATYSITPPNQANSTILKNPVSYTYTDVATNTIVASGSVPAPNLPPDWAVVGVDILGGVAIPGRTYQLVLTDGCGQTFTQNYTIPNKVVPSVTAQVINAGEACLDSVVGRLRIIPSGFGTGTRIVFTAGPATLGSTKPDYAYSDVYTWPSDTIYSSSLFSSTFFFSNLTAGTYHYTIMDDCGAKIDTFFTILPSQVANFGRVVKVTKGCPGENKLKFWIHGGGEVTVKDLSDNTVLKTSQISYSGSSFNSDSLLHLASGYYEITFDYSKTGTLQTVLNDNPLSCWKVIDTIFIPPYQSPEISVGNMIMCNGSMNFALTPDSSKGVPPYQYEVYAGPQTFPLQASNVFSVDKAGTYSVRIHDACGNATAKQITADTLSFEPLLVNSGCNNKKIILPSSIFYTYQWLLPNGQTYTGDSLVFAPVTPADTGTYQITQFVNIGNCQETVTTTAHISLVDNFQQTISLCDGNTVTVGTSVYDSAGIYSDTLISSFGCDSIVTTTISLITPQTYTITTFICDGDSILINGNYYSQAGIYTDSILNVHGCFDIRVTNLQIHNSFYTQAATICEGSSYQIGTKFYTTSGIFTDTLLATTGCDSIITLHLTVLPIIPPTEIYDTICENTSYSFAGTVLTTSGTYTDTLTSSASCDSIVMVHLEVLPEKYENFGVTICAGETYTFVGNTLTTSGTYTNTLLSSIGCDSIITLHLTVLPVIPPSHIAATICAGTSYNFNGNTLTASGTYTETFQSVTNCDSVVVLNLTVLPIIPPTHIAATICGGTSYTFHGNTLTTSGTYTDTLATTSTSCDSVVVLNLTVLPIIPPTEIYDTICENTNYSFAGTVLTTSGIYAKTVPSVVTGCDSVIVLHLNVLPLIRTNIFDTICQGEDYLFNGINYYETGDYAKTFATATCDSIVTLYLTVLPLPDVSINSNIISETENSADVVLIANSGNPQDSYFWQSDNGQLSDSTSSNPTISITEPTTVTLIVTDSYGCENIVDYKIAWKKTSTLYVPNAFTPDGDQFNNIFRAYGTNIARFHILIFNRWGEIIFESQDINIAWDGTYLGKIVQDGVYTYKIDALGTDNAVYNLTGHITVLK